jgi:hypothetical protein
MTKRLEIDSVRQVFNDGNHNAFTDLQRFNNSYYLTFRSSPDGHMLFTSSSIVVLRSTDTVNWQEVFRFNVPARDVRDPHFLVFDQKLFVYTGAWLVDPNDPKYLDMNDHLGFCAWSEDGTDWHGPRLLEGTHGHYIWRAAAHGESAYLIGRRVHNFAAVADKTTEPEETESWLLQSRDGFNWLPAGLIQPRFGDETAVLFEADGSALAVARSMGRRPAQLCRAQPPYAQWSLANLDRPIGGPLLAKWGDRYLVGGRKTVDRRGKTALYWLVEDRLEEVAELPSGGDTSYPGFIALSEEKGLLSYYSSHEGSGSSLAPSAIYLANLTLPSSD